MSNDDRRVLAARLRALKQRCEELTLRDGPTRISREFADAFDDLKYECIENLPAIIDALEDGCRS